MVALHHNAVSPSQCTKSNERCAFNLPGLGLDENIEGLYFIMVNLNGPFSMSLHKAMANNKERHGKATSI